MRRALRPSRFALGAGFAVMLAARAALAQEEPGAVVRGDPFERARNAAEGGARSVTVIDLREEGRVRDSIAHVLEQAPGVTLRSLGDGLASTTATLRGAPGNHVAVALDGVVLNDAGGDGVDLSMLPPALLERADVYRGSTPLHLGLSGLGGAIELHTRPVPPRPLTSATAGYGSFGARRANLLTAGRAGPWRALAAVGYRGTRGNFSFYDTDATPQNPGTFRDRRNNAADTVDVLGRLCYGNVAVRSACVTALLGWRERGVPGVVPFESDGPFVVQSRLLVRADLPWHLRGLEGTAFATVVTRTDRFVNDGPVPLPYGGTDHTRTTLLEGGTRLHHNRPRIVRTLDAMLRLRRESLAPEGPSAYPAASRLSALAALEASIGNDRARIEPAITVDALQDARNTDTVSRLLVSPRVGLRWRAHPSLLLRGTVGRFARAPSLPELYGDRGTIQGNPTLRPETALSADVGAVFERRMGTVRLRAEVVGWGRRVDDLIVLAQTSRATLRPYNFGGAWLGGVESEVRLDLANRLELRASYTLTRTRAREGDGLEVPFVARHDGALSGALKLGPVRVGGDLSLRSSVWLDASNRAEIPGRTLVGAFVSVRLPFPQTQSLTVRFDATNLANLRTVNQSVTLGDQTFVRATPIQDSFGYPLPGRAFFVSLAYDLAP